MRYAFFGYANEAVVREWSPEELDKVIARPAEFGARMWARLLALLAVQLRSLDLVEESLAEAFAAAVPAGAVAPPREPAAWPLTAARRHAIDRMRREAVARRMQPRLVVDEPVTTDEEIPDERPRLIFTCCHPALDLAARVALTLRCVGGLSTTEIARACLVPEPTMAARITRANKRSPRRPSRIVFPTGVSGPTGSTASSRCCTWFSTRVTARCGRSCAPKRSG